MSFRLPADRCLFAAALGLPLVLFLAASGLAATFESKDLSQSELSALIMLLHSNARVAEESMNDGGPGDVDALEFYSRNIATQVVAARCVICHVEGGAAPAGGARLIFSNDASAGQDATNVDAIRAYLELIGDRGATVLGKISGVLTHGGGVVFAPSTPQYQAVEEFLDALHNAPPDGGGPGDPAEDDLPLDQIELPEGFEITVFARAEGARSMVYGDQGTLFVGTGGYSDVDPEGRVYAARDIDQDGVADQVTVVASGLNNPNGVAFHNGDLYVAEIDRILKFPAIETQLTAPPEPIVIFDQLPDDAWHGWKYIAFGPDGKLYMPVGAPCNVCEPELPYAAIHRMNPDGSKFEVVARGVRNTVGFDWHPMTQELWFTDNGRDNLGPIPPDELNRLDQIGDHHGFPFCHGQDVKDPEFGPASCDPYKAPVVELGAHVASLGMTFYEGTQFPGAFEHQIFIAEHGSWNSPQLVGYKVSLVTDSASGAYVYSDFATGWLNPDGVSRWGRPVDVVVSADGSLMVSDDMAGAIYRITYTAR